MVGNAGDFVVFLVPVGVGVGVDVAERVIEIGVDLVGLFDDLLDAATNGSQGDRRFPSLVLCALPGDATVGVNRAVVRLGVCL